MDVIHRESHFNFIKIHVLSHFSDHIRHFGNIAMYSTEFGELRQRERIKDRWRQSNQNDARGQIVNSSRRLHAIRMRLFNLESHLRGATDGSVDILQSFESTTSAVTGPVVHRRILEGCRDEGSNVLDFSKVLGVPLESLGSELIRYSQHNLPTEGQLPKDHVILQLLLVVALTQLKITVMVFQESDLYAVHPALCMGTLHFRFQGSRNH